jgi:hypothetical protein
MKKLAMLITLAIATTAWAVTVITYNVPDVYGLKLLDALLAQSDADVRIQIRGHEGAPEPANNQYRADVAFYVPPRDPNLTNAEFVKRRIARFADALQLAHKRKLDKEIRDVYLAAAPVIDANAPDPNEMN